MGPSSTPKVSDMAHVGVTLLSHISFLAEENKSLISLDQAERIGF
jgi:hypothetical protein